MLEADLVLSRYSIICLHLFSAVLVVALFGDSVAQTKTKTVTLDKEEWQLTHRAEHCENLVSVAIAEYQQAPIYHANRKAVGDRFLVNGTSECWVELTIAGVEDVSFLFKVSQDRVVLDQRLLSWWGLKVNPYPNEPNGR